jgi:type IV fimbrial biogenesis protein FimT
MLSLRRQRGFSLIEALVGVVILSVLMAAGMPSFATFLKNRKVRSTTEALHNGLSLAKAEAVRRNTVITFTLDAGSGWALTCTNCAGDDLPTMPAGEVASETATAANNTTFNFNGFGKVSALAAGTTSATFDISNTKGSCKTAGGTIRCLRVVVTTGGQIRTCDPQLTVTNPGSPQAC